MDTLSHTRGVFRLLSLTSGLTFAEGPPSDPDGPPLSIVDRSTTSLALIIKHRGRARVQLAGCLCVSVPKRDVCGSQVFFQNSTVFFVKAFFGARISSGHFQPEEFCVKIRFCFGGHETLQIAGASVGISQRSLSWLSDTYILYALEPPTVKVEQETQKKGRTSPQKPGLLRWSSTSIQQ